MVVFSSLPVFASARPDEELLATGARLRVQRWGRSFLAEVTGLVEATAGDDLGPFIASHLPDFVGRAVDNVGAVYKRIVELQEELGRQRAAEEGAEGGAASSAAASE